MKVLRMIVHLQGPFVSWDSLGASDIWLSYHRATTCPKSALGLSLVLLTPT